MSDNVTRETQCFIIAAQIEQRRLGHRSAVHHQGTLCSRCLERPPRPNQRYCRECKNAYQREWSAKVRAETLRLKAFEQEMLKGNNDDSTSKDGPMPAARSGP